MSSQPMHRSKKILVIGLLCLASLVSAEDTNWHQAAGPNGNWQIEGMPPTEWSVTRNENFRWRTPLPEAERGSPSA